MRRLAFLAALALGVLALPARPLAQMQVNIQVALPAAPPLVTIQPGVQVVEDYDDEVFYTRGFYWVRRGPVWYRAPRPGMPFVVVERRYVPEVIYRTPPGHYRHWRHEQEKEARREWKEDRKEWKREHKHHGHGHGRGHDRDWNDRDDEPRPVVYRPAPPPAPAPARTNPHPGPHDARPAPANPGPHDARGAQNPWKGPHDRQ